MYSVFSIAVGAAGTCCMCKPFSSLKVFAILYGVLMFGIWVGVLTIGIVVTSVAALAPSVAQEFCDGNSLNYRLDFLVEQLRSIDEEINQFSGLYMCTEYCPCSLDYADPWLALSESTLNQWKRTKVAGTSTQDTAGNYRIITSSTVGEVTFPNFQTCSEYLLVLAEPPSDLPSEEQLNTASKILGYFEAKYKCSGVCTPSLFYYTLDLTEGSPQEHCLTYLKSEIGDHNMYMGVTAIVSGVAMFWVWLFQYCLWAPYKQ